MNISNLEPNLGPDRDSNPSPSISHTVPLNHGDRLGAVHDIQNSFFITCYDTVLLYKVSPEYGTLLMTNTGLRWNDNADPLAKRSKTARVRTSTKSHSATVSSNNARLVQQFVFTQFMLRM